jgi:hypothetical protein
MSTTDDTNAARRGSGSNDLLGLVELAQMCAHHCREGLWGPSMVQNEQGVRTNAAMLLDQTAAEIERLRSALERIGAWADAYPLEVFPEPLRQEWQQANEVLAQAGLSMTRMSASNMRHVISGVRKLVDEGLKA